MNRFSSFAFTIALLVTNVGQGDAQDKDDSALKSSPETNVAVVFHLKHAKASNLADVLDPLFAVIMVVEKTSNSLIVNAPRSYVRETGEVLKVLDELTARGARRVPQEVGSIHIRPLKHIQASVLVPALKSLFRGRAIFDQRPVFVADEATNTLLVRCDADRFQSITDLVTQLDKPARQQHSDPDESADFSEGKSDRFEPFKSAGKREPSRKGDLNWNSLRQGSMFMGNIAGPTKASDILAEQHRNLKKTDASNEQIVESKNRLRGSVVKEFDARQQLQQSQLSKLQKRLERIKQLITSREQIRKQIIDRRVEELLNPNLQWDSNSAQQKSTRQTTLPTGERFPRTPDLIGQDPGEPIYNEQLKRFKFRMEKVYVTTTEIAVAFFDVYRKGDNPKVIGVWGEPH